jgi:hypothetical protein
MTIRINLSDRAIPNISVPKVYMNVASIMAGLRPHESDPLPHKGAVMQVEMDHTAEQTPTQ